jgi:glutamate synthase domain-containing protein 2/glutamate synthase domain-containing protein 1/glutamate synthase domain-containing protein 3
MKMNNQYTAPPAQGLYDPRYEHDACGMGFVAHLKGVKSHRIVQNALTVLANLNHRGASGSEASTGDGAGIMLQIPHHFLSRVCRAEGITLPAPGEYGVGVAFISQDEAEAKRCREKVAAVITSTNQSCLGWRRVPTNNAGLGATSLGSEPAVWQFFIGRSPDITDPLTFERKLYLIRRRLEKEVGENGEYGRFYLPSLSSRTLVYKGMLLSHQLPHYYPDLTQPDLTSGLALVHSRFSTNTFPSWERAHPYRYIIHNGEINTLRGNINWMNARQMRFESEAFGDDLAHLLPIIDPSGSDTAMFDNVLEFLTLAGRPLHEAVMMMIPEPWENHEQMDAARHAFYEFHSGLMEPWDGPAAIGFSDGRRVGAVLDRNGLRPGRYVVTRDDLVVMASEAGVLDLPPDQIMQKGRLRPGHLFLVDTEAGRIVSDEEIKREAAAKRPYQQWLNQSRIRLDDLPRPATPTQTLWQRNGTRMNTDDTDKKKKIRVYPVNPCPIIIQQQAFGYTFEDLRLILAPMAANGVEALGSMGDDTPLAVLSHKPQLLYNYFRQLFAQVTNPPLDAIREELITSTHSLLGPQGNILHPTAEHAYRITMDHPLLTDEQFIRLAALDLPGFQVAHLDTLYPVAGGGAGLAQALDALFAQADQAIADGANLLILSDRGLTADLTPIPALLATAGLHHHLVRQGSRTEVDLIISTGEAREVHHFAVLLGYGADAIHPYLAYATIGDLLQRQMVTGISYEKAAAQFVKAAVKGIVKVMSKMGISTIQAYRGAQIFEAIGLSSSVIEPYFTGTASRIEGVGLDALADEVAGRHRHAFPARPVNGKTLPVGGRYQYREDGEAHLFNPGTIHSLQTAVRSGSYAHYQRYANDVNDHNRRIYTLRGLLDLRPAGLPVLLDEVESVESICQRFKTGAMSYGSISREAHESLAIAMNRIGGKSNTGEGGEDAARYTPDANGDSRSSAIKQVASGRFGVTSQYLNEAVEIQIKMAQGAKPGEGGQLPGHKVYPWIAKVRHSTPGVGLISPPPHHDIYSIEDLAQLIHDLKNANPQARINVKLVSEVGVGTVAAGVAKGKADVILISGHDGGTGASPQTSIKHAGMPWELGLAETHQTLMLNGLRSRVRLETDGQLKTGRDVLMAALLGAEEFGFATAPLVALGCIMMRVCHLNTCPVGIATQDPALRAKFQGDPQHVVNFMRFVAQEVRELMAELGIRTFEELIGRSDLLTMRSDLTPAQRRGLDLSPLFHQPAPDQPRTCRIEQDHGLDGALDRQYLLDLCRPALAEGWPIRATLPIKNVNRVVGTMLGSAITRRYGAEGLPDDTIRLHFQGSAGQSFGAFIPPGLTLELEGEANDYLGKGLSGGKIILYPPAGSSFVPEENIIIGNVALYGATSGRAFIYGEAGERFAVRNSGALAVVEAVGDHGCEYMTGGRVVVLGRTGRNFAAGMSGGIAYVLDETGHFPHLCNQEMVWLEPLDDDTEADEVRALIAQHHHYTGSRRAQRVLNQWANLRWRFVRVMPKEYKRALAELEQIGVMRET